MRPPWKYPDDVDPPKREPEDPLLKWQSLFMVTAFVFLFIAVIFFGCTAVGQPMPPPPPVTTNALPLPWIGSTNRVFVTTNAVGDTVILTTIVIPKVVQVKRHYYGVINSELSYLGEWTSNEYERWAYAGALTLTDAPEITRWTCIFATTNKIETPWLIHVRVCQ